MTFLDVSVAPSPEGEAPLAHLTPHETHRLTCSLQGPTQILQSRDGEDTVHKASAHSCRSQASCGLSLGL